MNRPEIYAFSDEAGASLAGQIAAMKRNGLAGPELRGVDGLSSIQRIGGRNESVTEEEAKDGLDVVTTIDANLQDMINYSVFALMKLGR